ncbi:hypothetical protein J6590_001597 [Homalodisca vitripennis]|nr:hypothetical protein J6590_001597 [Homalodisca vitripennis]
MVVVVPYLSVSQRSGTTADSNHVAKWGGLMAQVEGEREKENGFTAVVSWLVVVRRQQNLGPG